MELYDTATLSEVGEGEHEVTSLKRLASTHESV